MFVFGSSDNAFGTAGLGGSGGFADPDTGVGFSYVMNKMGFHFSIRDNPRLRDALFHDVLGPDPKRNGGAQAVGLEPTKRRRTAPYSQHRWTRLPIRHSDSCNI